MRTSPSLLALLACTSAPTPPPPAPAVDSGYVAVDGGSLFYERAGRGTAVVLLHPAYVDRRVWDPIFEPLARSSLMVRYDARGFGRSSPQTEPFSHADDLYRLIQALGLRQVTLVGNSLGGATAIDFALAHPDLVARLILFAPGLSGYPWQPADLNEPWRIEARAALGHGDTIGVARAWLHSSYLTAASENPRIAAILDTLLTDNGAYWKHRLASGRDLDTVPDPPAITRLGQITQPVILVLGTRDDPEIAAVVDTLEQHLRHATRVMLPGVGHVPSLEAPDVTAGIVFGTLKPGY